MATITITRKSPELATILARVDTIRSSAIMAINLAHDVRAELDIIGTLPVALRSTRAAAFAILSPQADFVPNVLAVPVLIDLLQRNADPDTIVSTLANVGYKMCHHAKALQYIASAPFILGGEPITYALAKANAGYGQKAASMATALYSEHSEVATLDTWMLNGMLSTANTGGKKNKNTYTASGPAYHDIEAILLDIAAELGVTPFFLQWSLWNLYRGLSTSHLGIFGL